MMEPWLTKQIDPFQDVRTAFNTSDAQGFFYYERAQALLCKLFPPSLAMAHAEEELPLLKWVQWGEREVSVLLLAQKRPDVSLFFYEMIAEGCLPGRRLCPSCFFAIDIQLPSLSDEDFTLAEMLLCAPAPELRHAMKQGFLRMESALKLGLESAYHAKRILETKGLTAEHKAWWIQERIGRLLHKWQDAVDFDIFTDMQHFLVMAPGRFKEMHSVAQLCRVICLFYLFRRELRRQAEERRARIVLAKVAKTTIHTPFPKQVIALFIGVQLVHDNEVFEKEHLLRAVRSCLPDAQPVEGSYFSRAFKEERIRLLYVEVQRGGAPITARDIARLRESVCEAAKHAVEQWMRPMFMPRNEEEVMRTLVMLSRELHQPRDLPQVNISFEGQTEAQLVFTVILLRVLTPSAAPMNTLLEKASEVSALKWTLERSRIMGMLRKRYPKEAAVLRVTLPAGAFVRFDHRINIIQARQEVLKQLQAFVGEVRDFNGGMIAKQQDQFWACRALFPTLDGQQEMLLETLFHSLFPIERRSVIEPTLMQRAFVLLNALIRSRDVLRSECVGDAHIVFLSDRFPEKKAHFARQVSACKFSSSQLSTLSLAYDGIKYTGYIFHGVQPPVGLVA